MICHRCKKEYIRVLNPARIDLYVIKQFYCSYECYDAAVAEQDLKDDKALEEYTRDMQAKDETSAVSGIVIEEDSNG